MVTLYSNNCPRCRVLKKKLEEKKIEYNEVNDIDQMVKMGFNTTPILEVDGQFFDFSQAIQWTNNN